MALMSSMVIGGHFGCFEVQGVRCAAPCRVSLSLFGSTIHGWPCSRCQAWILAMWLEIADPEYSDSKNPFHTNLIGGARSAPPNTVGIALSFGGVKCRRYSWLQDRPLGHVIWFTRR